jgi:hypothetical protein
MTKTTTGICLGLSLLALPLQARAADNDDRASRDEEIAACVENRERSFECKDPFIDAMIDLRLSRSGKKVTAEERAAMKAKGLEEIAEDGAGPLRPRQGKCAAMVDRLTKKGRRTITRAKLAAFKPCYGETDCTKRVSCMMPLLADLMSKK